MKRWLLMVVLTAGLVGCGDNLPEADFVFVTATAHHELDPQRISWLHDGRVVQHLFEPMVAFDFNSMTVKPGVAKRWEVSEDGRTYTFHLRDEARWSNGEAVTADDFIYAWRRALLPGAPADYSHMLFVIEGAEAFYQWRTQDLAAYAAAGGASAETAEAAWRSVQERFAQMVGLEAGDGGRTLVVRLEQPVPYFLQLAAFVTFLPVHATSVEAATYSDPATSVQRVDSSYFSDPKRLVSNGPYRLAATAPGVYMHLVANEHYWNKAALRNGSILERIIRDAQTAVMAYESGAVDFLPDVPSATRLPADLVAQHRDDVHTQAMAGTYFYNFNCQPTLPDGSANPLADARVRRAMAMAIDRAVLVERVTELNQPVARTFIPPGVIRGYEPPMEAGVGFDPEAARALLVEAGYPGGAGLTGLSILYNTDQGHERIAQKIQAMWREHLGVAVRLEPLAGRAFGARLKDHAFTIARASWFGDYPDPTTFLQKMATGDVNNDAGWSNPAFDALLAEARQERDPAQRMQVLREAEAILVREQPMALLFHYVNVYLWDPARVRGLESNAWAQWSFGGVEVE